MTEHLQAAKPSQQIYQRREPDAPTHYQYMISDMTKVKHPLVEPAPQPEMAHRAKTKKKHSWFVTIGTWLVVLKVGVWVWPYVEGWVIDIGLILLMILGLFLMYAFCVWLDNKTGGSGYSGPYDDDSYDAGWFDSWAFHNDGNDHNDNLY
ncbi:hypothetical protein [Secundilactobacillus silagei]|jgi:hypothetical protein|uniref:Uncharacterized protein n=1 Tax=Secundilactobacillus silagei JCM 19001 TaxID=1302250 RepID=A0A1Z5IG79_9LACO|nr:hypothetical protein [Secundilactobacillus silagei]TDG73406.1 hypothetical protein C5L25_000555 [Secundilactobacillus silagei JCM 19001]GAX00777.1 hypothetical protein IWT126_00792 [Secundilactobacillus silagei JCM 19001]